MHLTHLQKRNWAWWQMLFHPIALRSEFCNPRTFGQIHLSCAFCALPGWNMTQKICLLLHHWSIPPSHSMQYFILIGWKSPVLSGPDIIFWPVHKKSSANFKNVRPISQNIRCNIHTNEELLQNEVKVCVCLFGWNFSHLTMLKTPVSLSQNEQMF
jgi:hypothetical protein